MSFASLNTPDNLQDRGVDQFVTEEALKQFSQRQEAVLDTARHYGLTKENSVPVGSGALALNNVDTFVPLEGEDLFDLDVLEIEPPKHRKGARAILRRLVIPEVKIYRDEDAPLDLTVFRGTKAEQYPLLYGYPDLDSLLRSRVDVGDLATPSVEKLVEEKLRAGRLKDDLGLVKMQRVAHEREDRRQAEPYWGPTVGIAMHRLKHDPHPQRHPDWARDLVASDFDHTAYHKIPRMRKR